MSGSYAWTEGLKSIHYGPGCVTDALPKLIQTLGVKKGLIITGHSLYTKTDVVRRVIHILEAHAYPVAGINAGVKAFQDLGADFVVAVGGGSPIDAAKAIRYRIQGQTKGAMPIQIAIPTTLSAGEYTIGASYTDENGKKARVSHPLLAPAGIILDAELALHTPNCLWLSSGMRAVDHAVENSYRPFVSPPVKILYGAALADLVHYLPISKAEPTNVEVRQKLLLASWMSLWPTKFEQHAAGPFGLSHALGNRLGVTYGIPHGITSCFTLSPAVALQGRIASDSDKESLAHLLFHLREPSTGSIDSDIVKLSAIIRGLVEELGLQSTLREYNVPKDEIPKIAQGLGGRTKDYYYLAEENSALIDLMHRTYCGYAK
ncbi:alcohol dehydrogenase IV [Mycena leptocephala]|nr:alcohol dehydrogenase IV [Mycena leptocephala]